MEQALNFRCGDDRLVGVLAMPPRPWAVPGLGMLIVVGGPQYRAGSHRQFVTLARELAAAGHPVMRFDVRGMGDSSGAQRDFESLSDDIAAALDALVQQVPQLQRVVLMGLCDGASAALIYMRETADPRIAGLCLLNPWLRSEQSLAKTHVQHYYWQRVTSKAFWRKLLAGGVGVQALRGFGSAVKTARGSDAAAGSDSKVDFRTAMLQGWAQFKGPVALALSDQDLTAQEFAGVADSQPAWRQCTTRPGVQRWTLVGADHTLSSAASSREFSEHVRAWMDSLAANAAVPKQVSP